MKKIIILLGLTLFLLGCQKIVCNEPYIRVGEGCCLDENNNKICDKDELRVFESELIESMPKTFEEFVELGRKTEECAGKCVVKTKPLNAEPSAQFVIREDGKCDTAREVMLSGEYIAKGTPKHLNLEKYKCDACCVPIE